MSFERSLFSSLIDYAGLFPPAGLGMEEAVANYLRYRESDEAWMLGRFVVPAARLEELEGWLNGRRVSASVLGGGEWEVGSGVRVESVEMKASSEAGIFEAMGRLPGGVEAYFEITDLGLIPAIGRAGGRAKIRTGGVTVEAFPAPQFVAEFLVECARCGVAFKATAGLHHPLRCFRALTYAEDAPRGWMFGFLNLFLGAVAARERGLGSGELAELLVEEGWGGFRVTEEEIARTRREFAISFGSCSFEEPVAELKELHLIGS